MSDDFGAGVKILIQRMETNPEEFYIEVSPNNMLKGTRWGNLMSLITNAKLKGEAVSDVIYLEPAEIDALYEAYKKLRRKAFDDSVMRSVLTPEGEDTTTVKSTFPAGAVLRTPTPNPYAQLSPEAIRTEIQIAQHEREMLELQRRQLQNVYPYSNYPYGEEASQQGFGARVKKAMGIK